MAMAAELPERAGEFFDGVTRLVLGAIDLPVALVSDEGRITYANAAAEVFFGSSAAILARTSLAELLPFSSPLLALVEHVRRRNTPVHEYRLDLSSPRLGADCWVDAFASPVPELPGSVVLVLHERTLADKIERQISHRGSARSVAGLAAMLAHEIKNPLAGIRGAAQLLEATAGPEDHELTRLITGEADRIVAMVDRMEAFSDSGPIACEPVNIHDVLEKVKSIALRGFAKNLRIVEQYDPSLPLVHANHDLLVQVFVNLVKNSAEALRGRPQGEIVLSTAYSPGIRVKVPGSAEKLSLPLQFVVADNGPGVAEDILPIIFDPFITSKQTGSGLGLAMVAKIVSDLGGVIECSSSPAGTSFSIFMPDWRPEQAETQGAAA